MPAQPCGPETARLTDDDYRRLCAARDRGRRPGATARQRAAADAAVWEIVLRNRRLVGRFATMVGARGLEPEDAASVGVLGLYRAAEEFDPARKIRFSTYAKFWVRQAIEREAEMIARPVRYPAWFLDALSRFNAARNRAREDGRRYDFDAVADAVGMNARTRKTFAEGLATLARPVCPIVATRWETARSGEFPDFGGYEPADGIADPRGAEPADLVAADEMRASVRFAIRFLRPRQREVIRRRYGLGGGPPELLQAIADDLGITRSRVQQIEAEALRRLRKFDSLRRHSEAA